MTDKQLKEVKEYFQKISQYYESVDLHHGDCKGADEEAHNLVCSLENIRVVIHPPKENSLRAFCFGPNPSHYKTPEKYLKRNKAIIKDSELIIACPKGEERLRSGTWSTVRRAVKEGKPVGIIYPDGKWEYRHKDTQVRDK